MRLIMRQDVIDAVPELWRDTYRDNGYTGGDWITYTLKQGYKWKVQPEQVYDALMTLPRPLTAENVNGVIGNSRWTLNKCDECQRKDCEMIVEFGGNESDTAHVCPDCLAAALALVNKEN